ncbi:hypothetical protein ACIBEJ_00835 [Nonomuraea sp. NPDC050790]|uniref:hypothetical protein n=1 Tax=Nonomuraea sp. NPDC050790 TaxID=3364371 RepID=UPI00378E5D7F
MLDIDYTYVCTRATAEAFVAELISAYKADPGYAPELMDEGFDGRQWTIVWDCGPDEWAYEASYKMAAPKGTYLEPVRYAVLAICLP